MDLVKPFRFIHCADLHLTNTFPYSKINPTTGLGERFEEQLSVFDKICRYAYKNGIPYVLIAFDIFHTNNPTSRVRTEFAKRLMFWKDKGLFFIIGSGNHDTCGQWHSWGDLEAFKVKHIEFYSEMFIRAITPDVNVYIIPWAKDLIHVRKEDRNKINIMLAHLSVKGADYGNMYCADTGFSIKNLKSLGFDYIALGHFHKMQRLSKRVWYSGSIYQRDFRDMDTKYLLDVTVSKDSIDVKPIAISAKKFIVVTMSSTFDSSDIRGKIVKVLVKGVLRTNLKEFITRLKTYKPRYIVTEAIKEEPSAIAKKDMSILPLTMSDCIRLWLKKNKQQHRKRIYKKAMEVLHAVDQPKD